MKNELFSGDTDFHNNAVIGSYHDDFSLYVIGYKEAADILVDKVNETGINQDTLVYPIAFLYRQYIELQLKKFIEEARLLLREPSSFPQHHKIKYLWELSNSLMKRIINEISPTAGTYITEEDVSIINNVINDFVAVDAESFSFRYPKDKKGNKNLDGIEYINIRKLGAKINELYQRLEKFEVVVGMLLERRSAMLAEMRAGMDYY